MQAFGRDLQEAQEWCKKYKTSNVENDLHQAWDLYYHVIIIAFVFYCSTGVQKN